MLGNNNAYAVLAVGDLAEAKKFYGETLELKQVDENPGGVRYQTGQTEIFVYPSQFAGTNQATAALWAVEDLEATVESLKAKGVAFEHYDDLPDTQRHGDIHVMGEDKGAWFKDPAGNILSLVNQR